MPQHSSRLMLYCYHKVSNETNIVVLMREYEHVGNI